MKIRQKKVHVPDVLLSCSFFFQASLEERCQNWMMLEHTLTLGCVQWLLLLESTTTCALATTTFLIVIRKGALLSTCTPSHRVLLEQWEAVFLYLMGMDSVGLDFLLWLLFLLISGGDKIRGWVDDYGKVVIRVAFNFVYPLQLVNFEDAFLGTGVTLTRPDSRDTGAILCGPYSLDTLYPP